MSKSPNNAKIRRMNDLRNAKHLVKFDRKQKETSDFISTYLQQTGIIGKDGLIRPYALKTFAADQAGAMSKRQIAAVIGIAAALALAGGAYYFLSQDGGNNPPPTDNKPVIDSWYIQDNALEPILKVNVSDDHAVKKIDVGFYNKTTGQLKFAKSYTPNTKIANISDNFNLSAYKGEGLSVKVNATDDKDQKTNTLEKIIQVPTDPVNPPPVNLAPLIESWSIANNTKQPDLYLNVSDSDNNVKNATVKIYDSLDQLIFSKEYTVNAASKNITDTIDLTAKPKGNYTVKVEANDALGKNSTMLEKIISLPNSVPRITDIPWIWYDSGADRWHIQANATDDDGILDYIHVRVYDPGTNTTANEGSKTINAKSGIFDFNSDFIHGYTYGVEVWAVDKDGAISQKKYDIFNNP